jgi:glycosyltransferase involved in cell wall biosynthesis
MRILHVTEALGGGIQSALANYVEGVDAIEGAGRVEHAVFSRARAGQQTRDAALAAIAHERFEGALPGFFRRLRAKVRDEQPDVVHLHSSFAGAARAVLPPSVGVVYSPHCYAMERRDVPAPARLGFALAEYALGRRRHQVTVAVSPREAQISTRLNPRNPAVVALNPSPFGREARRQRLWSEREIVMVGRISAQKDPSLFARVAHSCRDLDCRFVWIGDGASAERSLLAGEGIEVTGWAEPGAVRQRLTGAALYLHTAAWEGGPVSTIEAAALGVPVLARTIPSMRSLGYPLAGETAAEVASSVHRFFDDDAYAEEVGRRTRGTADAARPAQMASGLREAYTRAAAWTSRGRPRAR